MADDAREVVLGLFEAFDDGDMPGVLSRLDEDIDWLETPSLPWGGQKTGRQQVTDEVFARCGEFVPDMRVVPEEVRVDGDTVMILQRYQGNGGKLDVLGSGVWTVRDGKVTRYRQFIDSKTFNAAITR